MTCASDQTKGRSLFYYMTELKRDKESRHELIGLLPAGGKATRIAPLPCSKELYPIGFRAVNGGGSLRPKVICHYLLEKMRFANVSKAYIILREGKWDIPAYLGDGTLLNMHLAYLIMHIPFGAPYTLDQAYPFVNNALVAFGFPDIFFEPADAYVRLLSTQAATNADVVLGLFPTNQPQKMDMVDIDSNGRVLEIVVKPFHTNLHYTWIIAVWTPVFTSFMHEYLCSILRESEQVDSESGEYTLGQHELFLGEVVQAAISNDLTVLGVVFPNDSYIDIGTPEDLVRATDRIE